MLDLYLLIIIYKELLQHSLLSYDKNTYRYRRQTSALYQSEEEALKIEITLEPLSVQVFFVSNRLWNGL